MIGLALASPDVVAGASIPPRLPISAFSRLPFIEGAALSPDGHSLAGLFGGPNGQIIGIKNLLSDAKLAGVAVPDGTQARWVRWVNDDNIVVGLDTLLPVAGDRWYVSRLVGINVHTGKLTKLLWNLNGQNAADVLWIPTDGTTEILVAAQASIYLNDDFWPAVYRVDVATGHAVLAVRGQAHVSDWTADDRGRVRTGLSYIDSSRTFRLLYRSEGDRDAGFKTIAAADSRKRERMARPFLFLPDANHALVLHDDESGRTGIYETDLMTQEDTRAVFVLPADSKFEVAYPILSSDGATLLGAATTDPDGEVHWIDPSLAELQSQFDKAVPGKRVRILSFSKDRSMMLVRIDTADTPGLLYYYDVLQGRLIKIAEMNSEIGSRRLAPVKLVRYKARDGLEIEGVLTLPAGVAPHDLPFIVLPHGGPWARDGLAYDYWAQFLANRGYAVLQPNFRGSTGYGTDFLRKGEGQLGLAMQDDVTDGVRWAIREGLAAPSRVCIVGASYGGYAAMWGIVRDPTLYRCAISIAGVSSLRREVNDFGGSIMSGKFKDDWGRMTPDFAAVSPINAVDRIKTPLLLIHGKKDVTVDASQSARMFARMTDAGKIVDYVSLPLADHYFDRQPDREAMLKAIGTFLDKNNPANATVSATTP